MTEPTTEAGRALFSLIHGPSGYTIDLHHDDFQEAIAQVEAEAAQRALDDGGLTFAEFARTNRARCESPEGFGHPLDGWTLSDWFLAAIGEFGEAANVAKKLNRVRDGIPGNKETPDELQTKLRGEVADALIYLDLLAQSAGFLLADAVVATFNAKSEQIGAPHRLAATPPGPHSDSREDEIERCDCGEIEVNRVHHDTRLRGYHLFRAPRPR